jgi:DNA-binding transcriptional ArsR family regulator
MTRSFWAAATREFGYATGVAPPARLSDRTRELMSARFRALGEPMRLKILERLFRSPASVGEILDAVGGTQANVSKHLAVLRSGRLVSGRKEGNRTVYSISDPALERLCSVVCEAVSREARAEARAVAAGPTRRRR